MKHTLSNQQRDGEDPRRDRLSLDTALELLANPYRRRLVVALLEKDSLRNGRRAPLDGAASDADEDRLLVEMTHVHLPKLDDAAVIEWDRETHDVEKGPRFDELRPLIRAIQEQTARPAPRL